jgi:hypothetical protein
MGRRDGGGGEAVTLRSPERIGGPEAGGGAAKEVVGTGVSGVWLTGGSFWV